MSSNYRSKLRSAARRREEPQSPSEQTQSYDSSSASPRPEASPQRQTSTRANATNQSKESTRARMSGQRTAASQAEASARSEGSTNDQTFLTSPRSPVLSQELESSETQDLSRFFPQTPYNRRKEQAYGDRFIPTRDDAFSARDIYDMELYLSSKSPDEVNTEKYQNRLRMEAYFRSEVLGDFSAATEYASGVHTPRRILSFSTTPSRFRRSPSPTYLVDSPHSWKYRTSPIGEAGTIVLNAHQRALRYINRSSIKILDAPELQDDFYLNLIDWGSNDCLAVGLGNSVYLWNASTSKVTRLCEFADDLITSVSWASTGNRLAVGTDKGHVCLYDTEIGRRIRRWEGHSARTGSLAWNFNVLTSGGRDHKIFHHDIRSATEYFCELTYHVQEVCGLKWNPEGTMLASGGNDNNLLVWDSTSSRLLHRFDDHTAAIKAIAWSPHTRGRLASGGGTADKTIKFWNAISGAAISSHNTGAQVCNLAWSKRADELVSSHGFSSSSERSSNQVIVWKADSMQRLATLSGHTSRVLYMSMSSDCSTVVTGAGDETLRFWEIYSQAEPATRPMDLKLLR